MWGTGGTHDFFEGKFDNPFEGWSIQFQAAHDDAEHNRGQQCAKRYKTTDSLTISDSQLKTWNHMVLRE